MMSDEIPPLSVIPTRPLPRWLQLLLLVLGSAAVTAVVGVLAFIWIVSRAPILILLVIVLESVATGAALAWLIRRLKVRSLGVMVIVGTLCGLAGSTYTLYAFYVREANYFHERKLAVDNGALRNVLPLLVKPGTKAFEQAATELDRDQPKVTENAFEEFDRAAIYPATKHHGLYGYLLARGAPGAMLILLHVAIVVFLAVQFGWVLPKEAERARRLQLPAA